MTLSTVSTKKLNYVNLPYKKELEYNFKKTCIDIDSVKLRINNNKLPYGFTLQNSNLLNRCKEKD